MASNYSNYGNVTLLNVEGRKFYSNESDSTSLVIQHERQGTISVITEGEIKLGSMSSGKFLSINQGTLSTSYASINTITDGTTILKKGTISGLLDISTTVASITKNLHTGTLTDSVLTIESGTITNANEINTAIATITSSAFIEKLTDGGLTMENGSLTGGANTFITSKIGSFTNLYTHDLFVEDDVVMNGNTTFVNSTQLLFEDELISIGASNGRSIASTSGTKVLIAETNYNFSDSDNVVMMDNSGTKEFGVVSSTDNTTLTLNAAPSVLTLANITFVAKVHNEATADGTGIEILAFDGTNNKTKTFHYVNGATTMEVISENAKLDLRLNNTTDTSYFSVYDDSTHKKLLTSDGLFINTTSSGTITNSTDVPAIYMSKNGETSDSTNDWRMRVNSDGDMSFEQYNGSSWVSKWSLSG